MTSSIKEFVLSLVDYMKKAGYVSSPVPNVRLVSKPQTDDPRYAKTGHYSPEENEIVLYTANRHPKDILRTLAHELIHVQQDHEKRLTGFDGRKALRDDQRLRDLESEAFLKGNLALRDWTEQYTKQKMNEGNMKITLTLKQLRRLINEANEVETGNVDFEISDETLVKYNGKADKIAVPEGVKIIGKGAFQDNKYVKEVTIPDGVETIEDDAFLKCRGLTKVIMSDSVSEIGEQAFANCVALKEINIGKSVKTLGKNAFFMCQNLQQIVLQEGLETIDKGAFARTGLTALDIPASVKVIGYDILSGCQKLQRISVADQKQYSMFVKNSNLQSSKFNQSNIVVRGNKLNESSFDGFVVVENAEDYPDGKIPWSILDGMRKQQAKNRVNKIMGDYRGMFKDDNWQNVHKIFDRMLNAGLNLSYGPINDYRHSGGYYRDDRGCIAGKEWEFTIDYLNEKERPTELKGVVIASYGGTVEQHDNDYIGPERPYDLCAYFIN